MKYLPVFLVFFAYSKSFGASVCTHIEEAQGSGTKCEIVGISREYLVAKHALVKCETEVWHGYSKPTEATRVIRNLKAPLGFKGSQEQLKRALVTYYVQRWNQSVEDGKPDFDLCTDIKTELVFKGSPSAGAAKLEGRR